MKDVLEVVTTDRGVIAIRIAHISTIERFPNGAEVTMIGRKSFEVSIVDSVKLLSALSCYSEADWDISTTVDTEIEKFKLSRQH